MRRIYRYEVPVDDRGHDRELTGDPIAVGCRDVYTVEFWAVTDDSAPSSLRRFTVVGTGHQLPPDLARHWGTAVTMGGSLVWHLIEVES